MICDWLGAGIVYSKQKVDFNEPYSEPFDYYNSHLEERIFHPKTQELIEEYLKIIKYRGINAFCDEIKNQHSYIKNDYEKTERN